MFQLPGLDHHVRLFERVETTDGQYDIFDIGIKHPSGGIDSIAVGGSFHSIKSLCGQIDEKKLKMDKLEKELAELKGETVEDEKALESLQAEASTTKEAPVSELQTA